MRITVGYTIRRIASFTVLLVLGLMCSNPTIALSLTHDADGRATWDVNGANADRAAIYAAAESAVNTGLLSQFTYAYPAQPASNDKLCAMNAPRTLANQRWADWSTNSSELQAIQELIWATSSQQAAGIRLVYQAFYNESALVARMGSSLYALYAQEREDQRQAYFAAVNKIYGAALVPAKPPSILTLLAKDESTQAKLSSASQAAEQIIAPLRGDYAVYFYALNGGGSFALNGQFALSSASLMKMPTLIALYREADAGRINLDTVYTLEESDMQGGAGILADEQPGYALTYRELARLMGEYSDNTAYEIITRVLGESLIQETINLLGMSQTSFVERLTTAEDMGVLFRKLYQGQVVSDQSRDEILSFIINTAYEDRISLGIPDGITVAHKVGTKIGILSDAGIVFAQDPYILVIMSQRTAAAQASWALPEISRIIYAQWEQ
ncbi:MAG: class A beta-lactamase-related serine hydrolase [Chloroflexi bacterium]|nr:class A beta-lactamase-related serine hydrolase [Chloroflexota bacterium]